MKFGRREIGEIVPYLAEEKTSAASQTVATAQIAPKICQSQPPNNVLTVLLILSKSAQFLRSYSRTREHRQIALSK